MSIYTADTTFALTMDASGTYSAGTISTVFANAYGCTSTGITAAGLVAGSYPNAGYA